MPLEVIAIGHIFNERIQFPDRTVGPLLGATVSYSSVVLGRLGAGVGIVSNVGRDTPADLLRPISEAGVDTAGLHVRSDAPTTTTLLVYRPDGTKKIEYVKKAKRRGIPPAEEQLVRHKLTDLQVQFEVGRLLTYRVAWVLDQGRLPNYEAAMAKAFCTAFEQHLARMATQILGTYGQLRQGSKWVPPELRESATESYLFSPGYSIQGGTSEVLRNIVALIKDAAGSSAYPKEPVT